MMVKVYLKFPLRKEERYINVLRPKLAHETIGLQQNRVYERYDIIDIVCGYALSSVVSLIHQLGCMLHMIIHTLIRNMQLT